MKYFYNENHEMVIFYPENWFDVLRNFLLLILFPLTFSRTWKKNPYWYKSNVAGCIEARSTKTNYPDEASC